MYYDPPEASRDSGVCPAQSFASWNSFWTATSCPRAVAHPSVVLTSLPFVLGLTLPVANNIWTTAPYPHAGGHHRGVNSSLSFVAESILPVANSIWTTVLCSPTAAFHSGIYPLTLSVANSVWTTLSCPRWPPSTVLSVRQHLSFLGGPYPSLIALASPSHALLWPPSTAVFLHNDLSRPDRVCERRCRRLRVILASLALGNC